MKLSDEQRVERKSTRRMNRSLFFSRLVDEFKKIMVLYATAFVTGFLVWEHIIYGNGTTPAFPPSVTIALITGFFSTIVAYCFASYLEKNSLNKNGFVKGKDGVIEKAAQAVSTIIKTVTGNTTATTTTENDDSDDSEVRG